MRKFSTTKQQFYGIIGGLTAVLIVIAILLSGPVHRQLDAWKVLPQPERLTELFYTDHTKLPTTYVVSGPQSFGFTVHNLEYRPTTYGYVVAQQSADGSMQQALASGSFDLKQDVSKTVPVSFTANDLGNRAQIVTTLKNQTTGESQSIHYWVTKI